MSSDINNSEVVELERKELISPLEMPDKPKIETTFDKVLISIATPDNIRYRLR